jgi:hypothetical protein
MKRALTYSDMWKALGIVMRYVQIANRRLHDRYYLLSV